MKSEKKHYEGLASVETRDIPEIKLAGADLAKKKLKRIELQFANLYRANLEGAGLYRANLEGTDLNGANLGGADLKRADLEETNLREANLKWAILEGAKLTDADLTDADLSEANLEGAIIRNAKLLGTKCCLASVDGQTVITNCEINDKTDFTGVGLSGSRVDPRLHTQLLRNIRKMQWEKWYAEKKILTFFKQHGLFKRMEDVSKEPNPSQNQPNAAESASVAQKIKARFATIKTWIVAWAKAVVGYIVQISESLFMNLPIKVFWKISNYGSSTKRIIIAFLLLNGIFTLIYLYPVIDPTSLLGNTSGLLRGFMQTTLIPFSIIEIATKNISDLMMFFVTIHVILGYVILAALVTRFAVMFQDTSP